MSETKYLQNVSGNYRFRRRWPTDIWKMAPGQFFIRVINTSSKSEAILRRPHAEIEFNDAVAKIRAQMDLASRPFGEREVSSVFGRWFNQEVGYWDKGAPSTRTDEEYNEWKAQVAQLEAAFRRDVGRDDLDSKVEQRLCDDLAAWGINPNVDSDGWKKFRSMAARGWVELCLREKAKLDGDPSYDWQSPDVRLAVEGLGGSSLDSGASRVHTIGSLIEAYSDDQSSKWSESTRRAYRPILRLLREFFGSSRDLATITREEGRDLFAFVQRIPRNVSKVKETRGLTLLEAVKVADRHGLARLSPKTVNDSYKGLAGAIFNWAVREGWMKLNPLSRLSAHDDVAANAKRDPFTGEQIQAIFDDPEVSREARKPINFWAPRIALFSGMRVGEIASLRLSSIAKQEGEYVFLIEKGKGKNARRLIPVHPDLVGMGFIDFVEERYADAGVESVMLFDGEKVDSKGAWGRGVGSWLTRRVKELGIVGRKLGMHSFRHCFEDALRQADLHEPPMGQYLTGRTGGQSRSASAHYGAGYSTQKLADSIRKVHYTGVAPLGTTWRQTNLAIERTRQMGSKSSSSNDE